MTTSPTILTSIARRHLQIKGLYFAVLGVVTVEIDGGEDEILMLL